jgi:chromosome segregation ATPase
MDMEAEITKLHARRQRQEVKREGLLATLEGKRASREKLLAKLGEKGISPENLPGMITDLEAKIEAKIKEVQTQLDESDTALGQIEKALQTPDDDL